MVFHLLIGMEYSYKQTEHPPSTLSRFRPLVDTSTLANICFKVLLKCRPLCVGNYRFLVDEWFPVTNLIEIVVPCHGSPWLNCLLGNLTVVELSTW